MLISSVGNWKICLEEDNIVAEQFDKISSVYHHQLVYTPTAYVGRTLACPNCGSLDLESHTYYRLPSGEEIGDEADPCINCNDCGAIDIHPNFV